MALQGSSRNNLISLNNKGNNTLMGLNVMLHISESDLNIDDLYGEPVVCISVIDESNNLVPDVGSPQDEVTITADWNSFRATYPNRPFYLLQPRGNTTSGPGKNNRKSDVLIPDDVDDDDPVGSAPNYGLLYSTVNRDNGSPFFASDWFTICGLGTYPANTLVSLFIDTSGSMTLRTVQASYNKFLADCQANNIIVAGNSQNQGERWAVDHNKTFSELIDLITITKTLNQSVLFYGDGIFLEALQDSLLDKKIGNDLQRFPNLYGYMGQKGRNSSAGTISITNPDGTLSISNSFMRGETTGSATKTNWVNSYYSNVNNHTINVCDVTENLPNGGRLTNPDSTGVNSADVHGNIFSLFTTPNTIRSQTPGFFGTVLSSRTRRECYTLIITDSKEQIDGPGDLIGDRIEVINSEEISPGLIAERYLGYFGSNVNYEQTAQLDPENFNGTYSNPMILNEINQFFKGTVPQTDINGNSSNFFNNKTWVISGSFRAPQTGNYKFRTTSDDGSYFWINRTENFTTSNATVNNGGKHTVRTEISTSITLEQGEYYPIRIIYGNDNNLNASDNNPTELTLEWSINDGAYVTDGTGIFFQRFIETELRRINDSGGDLGEPNLRRYRVIALSGYESTDGYDGVLFYGSAYAEPYAYVTFTGTNTNDYTITRSSTAPNWTKKTNQKQDTLPIAEQTQGGLFKSSNVFQNGVTDYRKPFAEVISQFMEDTLN